MIFSVTNKSFGKIKTVITKRDFKHDHLFSDHKQFNEFICISSLFFNQLGSYVKINLAYILVVFCNQSPSLKLTIFLLDVKKKDLRWFLIRNVL